MIPVSTEASPRPMPATAVLTPTTEVACDGQWHVQTFTVSQADYGFGTLQQGQGYVQFCLFDGDGVYFGTQSGSVFSSRGGWRQLASQLPPVCSVEAADL